MTWYYDQNTGYSISDKLSDFDTKSDDIVKLRTKHFAIKYYSGVLKDWLIGLSGIKGEFTGIDMETEKKENRYYDTRFKVVTVVIDGVLYDTSVLQGAPRELPCIIKVREEYGLKFLTHVFPLCSWKIDRKRKSLVNPKLPSSDQYNAAPLITAGIGGDKR